MNEVIKVSVFYISWCMNVGNKENKIWSISSTKLH